MYRVNGTNITMTRGDTVRLKVSILDSDNVEYIPSINDKITFGLKKDANDEECLIEKIIPSDTCVLQINPDDTKLLSFGEYRYDISIEFSDGTVNTFITYAKFRIKEEIA